MFFFMDNNIIIDAITAADATTTTTSSSSSSSGNLPMEKRLRVGFLCERHQAPGRIAFASGGHFSCNCLS